MRGLEIVAIVIALFFVIGMVAGMLLLTTLPVLRFVLLSRRIRRAYIDGGNWWKPLAREDGPYRWPGA